MQPPKIEQDLHALLPNNPFVPPNGDMCLINKLPPELLSRIFEVGAADDGSEDEEEIAQYYDNLRPDHVAMMDTDDKDVPDSDVEMMEEPAEGDLEDTEDEAGSDVTESSDFPPPWPLFQIVVSHVCHHWRNVAFSTPSLWTTISVPPMARPPYHHVSTLLERSKGLPIDIYVDCEPHEHDHDHDDDLHPADDDAPSDADLKFLYSLLIPHVHRWRSIEIGVSSYQLIYVFLDAASDPSVPAASQLTTLQLYHHEETEEFESFGYPSLSKQFTLFGGVAPCLTSIALWGVHVDWNQPWIASGSKLTDLELAYHTEDVRPSWAQFSTILRGAPALENLSLCLSGPYGEHLDWVVEPTPGSTAGDLNAPIQLLKLTDFVLAFQSPARAIGLLHKLYLPALKSLTLDFDNGDYTEFVHHLAGPATSISPTSAQEQPRSLLSRLDNLKIAGLPCRTENVETLYGELQNLKSLNLSLSYLPRLFLDILCRPCTLTGRGDTWLPRLKTLYISGTSGDDIRKVVQKRRCAGVPLKSLYVEESCELDNVDVEWFKQNVETFDFFEGSDDEDMVDIDDPDEAGDEWSDVE